MDVLQTTDLNQFKSLGIFRYSVHFYNALMDWLLTHRQFSKKIGLQIVLHLTLTSYLVNSFAWTLSQSYFWSTNQSFVQLIFLFLSFIYCNCPSFSLYARDLRTVYQEDFTQKDGRPRIPPEGRYLDLDLKIAMSSLLSETISIMKMSLRKFCIHGYILIRHEGIVS